MFSRPKRNPRLQPVWVPEQYLSEGATLLATETVGNTNWVLGYSSQVLPNNIEPPPQLLNHFVYLQSLR